MSKAGSGNIVHGIDLTKIPFFFEPWLEICLSRSMGLLYYPVTFEK